MEDRSRRSTLWLRSIRRMIVFLPLCAGLSGCLGPGAVRYTRMRYNEVVRDTNDEQLLMNIVRLRYADSPVFIDLPNITSQFELAAGGSDPGPAGSQTNFGVGGLSGSRHADLELPSARGTIAKASFDPAFGRSLHRGQRRGRHRAAPADDGQRPQRRAKRPPSHNPDTRRSPTTMQVPPRHPTARVAPGARSHRASVRDG